MGASQSRNINPLEFKLLTKDEGQIALMNAERGDSYRFLCSKHKANLVARREQQYEAYGAPVEHRVVIEETLKASVKYLPRKLQDEIGEVNVVILFPSADGGMPHTRPQSTICFPFKNEYPEVETITHELWHIHQRMYPEFWQRVLKSQWDFEPYDGELPFLLEKQRRFNPDTIKSQNWIWRNTWIPVPILQNVTQPVLGDCKIWFYNVKTERVDHDIPVEVREYFGNMNMAAFEHPYEMAAYMLSGQKQYSCPAWIKIKDILNY